MSLKQTKEALDSFWITLKEEYSVKEEILDKVISWQVEDLLSDISIAIEHGESPLEKVFSIYLQDYLRKSRLYHMADVFDYEQQEEIQIGDKKYRVDFLVNYLKAEGDIDHRFVIECDGHEFHEKTKEQVKRDKERERKLMSKGFIVIRFSSSEIYERPAACAREAITIIERFILGKYKRI